MAKKNIRDLYLSTTSEDVKNTINTGGEIYITSNIDVLLAERGLDYQRTANISGVRNMTISDIASCRKSKLSLDHTISLMVALRITDIREIVNVVFTPETIKKYKKEREQWTKDGIVPAQLQRKLMKE